MSSQGPSPCLAASDLSDGSDPWNLIADGTNPANGSTSGLVVGYSDTARFTMGANNFSTVLTPVGVVVQITWDQPPSPGTTVDYVIRLTVGGSPLGSNKALSSLLPTSSSVTSYGGSSDTWGATLTNAIVNDSTFGVDIQVNEPDFGDAANIFSVDITVYDAFVDATVRSVKKRLLKEEPYVLKQSQTAEPLEFFMADSTDHITGLTGLSPTVTYSKNGGAFSAAVGAVSEIGNGWYKVAGNATDADTLGPLLLHATATGADVWDGRFQVVGFDPRDSVRMGQTALPNANAEAAGGLFTRGTGAGQVNQDANGRMDVNLAAVSADTTTATIMKSLYGSAVISGTVNAVTSNSDFTLTSTGLTTNDGDYANMWLVFTSGSNQGVLRLIGTYTGASKQVQFTGAGARGAFPETVTAADSFLILAAAA